MILESLLLLAVAGAASSVRECPKPADLDKPLTVELKRSVDVDGDGEPDVVSVRITATKFTQPFRWEFTIVSKGRVLLRHEESNKGIDASFGTPGYIGDCHDYLECKCKWYFHDFLNHAVYEPISRLADGVYDRSAPNAIYAVARPYLLKHCGAEPKTVDAAIDRAVDRLRANKAAVVEVPREPESPASPVVWFPEFSCFAPIYED